MCERPEILPEDNDLISSDILVRMGVIKMNEMASDRAAIIDLCNTLGKQFVKHFDKIYRETNQNTIKHHAKEMQTWLNKVSNQKLSLNNKYLNEKHIYDWFITCGKTIADLFDNEIEACLYDDFQSHLLDFDRNVLESLKAVGLYKEEM